MLDIISPASGQVDGGEVGALDDAAELVAGQILEGVEHDGTMVGGQAQPGRERPGRSRSAHRPSPTSALTQWNEVAAVIRSNPPARRCWSPW